MNPAGASILQQPFVQVALPIIVALMLAAWLQNKRFDDLNRSMDQMRQDLRARIDQTDRRIDELRHDVNERLARIESKLDNHHERIARVEERTSLVR